MPDSREGRSSDDMISLLSAPGLIDRLCSVEGKWYDSLSAASAATKKSVEFTITIVQSHQGPAFSTHIADSTHTWCRWCYSDRTW